MKRLLAAVILATAISLLVTMASPASPAAADEPEWILHHNPNEPDNPYAWMEIRTRKMTGDRPEVCVALYKAPPAFGQPLWNKPAKGGNPGWILQLRAGTPWTCSPHDPLE